MQRPLPPFPARWARVLPLANSLIYVEPVDSQAARHDVGLVPRPFRVVAPPLAMDVMVQSHSNMALAQPYQTLSEVLQHAASVDASVPRYSRWQDVLDAMEAAMAQDQAKAAKSSLRARVRKSAADLVLLESLMGMIPEQDGLSVLRCGLATLFKVSNHPPPFPCVLSSLSKLNRARRWWASGLRPEP